MHESQCAKYVQSQQRKYKNHVQDIVLLFLLFRGVILRSQSNIDDVVFFAKVVNREEKKIKFFHRVLDTGLSFEQLVLIVLGLPLLFLNT